MLYDEQSRFCFMYEEEAEQEQKVVKARDQINQLQQ
jgi:hypothetical protein